MSSTNNTIVLVTGSNKGIGFSIAQALLSSTAKGYTIILTSRTLSRAQQAAQSLEQEVKSSVTGSQVFAFQLDIEDDGSIETLFAEVEKPFGRVDVLVNNAGASFDIIGPQAGWTERELWAKTYNLNVVSTRQFTRMFIPLLLKSTTPRLLFMTSTVSSLTETSITAYPYNTPPKEKGWPKTDIGFNIAAYRASKTALNMQARDWHQVLQADGVIVHLIDPGRVATEFGGGDPTEKIKTGASTPDVPAGLVKRVIEGELDQDRGKIVGINGIVPW
ncbi:hypothetical protein CI109_100046 [Kwoniella shandongensis]|uniref:Uncharacterized protein n=1 Tax=Kwoniella shandongensis TaxID=1734106 RepID=A0A5M6BS79_9TREE|nr:uncharacterized protein CI109_005981 [Kwoniella shandongensis]KAA5525673.1 hypothetical protein CI109_005981 [Kwoniella shandongensis]